MKANFIKMLIKNYKIPKIAANVREIEVKSNFHGVPMEWELCERSSNKNQEIKIYSHFRILCVKNYAHEEIEIL